MRTLCLALGIVALAGSRPALAGELLRATDDPVNHTAVGWTMVGLSLASFAVAANGVQESQDALDEADRAYAQYQAATIATDATRYRNEVNKWHRRARAFESTANGAAFLGVVFALTAYYSFVPEQLPQSPFLVTANSVGLRYRF